MGIESLKTYHIKKMVSISARLVGGFDSIIESFAKGVYKVFTVCVF